METDIAVDMGACKAVMPADLRRAIAILQSPLSPGPEYKVASGAPISSLGERRCLRMAFGSTEAKKLVSQLADVH